MNGLPSECNDAVHRAGNLVNGKRLFTECVISRNTVRAVCHFVQVREVTSTSIQYDVWSVEIHLVCSSGEDTTHGLWEGFPPEDYYYTVYANNGLMVHDSMNNDNSNMKSIIIMVWVSTNYVIGWEMKAVITRTQSSYGMKATSFGVTYTNHFSPAPFWLYITFKFLLEPTAYKNLHLED